MNTFKNKPSKLNKIRKSHAVWMVSSSRDPMLHHWLIMFLSSWRFAARGECKLYLSYSPKEITGVRSGLSGRPCLLTSMTNPLSSHLLIQKSCYTSAVERNISLGWGINHFSNMSKYSPIYRFFNKEKQTKYYFSHKIGLIIKTHEITDFHFFEFNP
jgi:hypothetical protein